MSGKGTSGAKTPLRKLRPAQALQPRPAMVAKSSRKSRARNACMFCQQTKKKCDEAHPKCSSCVETGHECAYSIEDTARYKRAMARNKIKDYEAEIEKYERILDHIKNSSVSSLQRILSVIRGQAPLEDIMLFIRGDHSPYLPTDMISPEPATSDLSLMMNEAWESLQSGTGGINPDLINDIPILNITAAPWVTITDNNELVSHLMSLYLTWDHPVWHLFDFDIFIDAMKNGDSTYCSPVLVNAILAEACHYTNRIKYRSDPLNPNFLGYRFFQEAMRLWTEETSQPDFMPTLVTVQSAFMLGVTLAADGLDRLGGMFLNNGIRMTKEVLLSRSDPGYGDGKGKGRVADLSEADQKYDYAKNITIWAAFNFQSMYDWVARMEHTMPVPDLPLPYLDVTNPDDGYPPHPIVYDPEDNPFTDLKDATTWRPYPWCGDSEPNVTRMGFQAHARFHLILYEIAERQMSGVNGEKKLTLAEKKRFYRLLDEWKECIPTGFEEGLSYSPSPMFVHSQYHVTIIDIHNITIKDKDTCDGDELAEFEIESANRYQNSKAGLYKMLHTYNHKNTMITMSQPLTFAMLIASQNAIGSLAKAKGVSSVTPSDQGTITIPRNPYDEDHITTTFENTLNWLCHASTSFVTIKIFARLMQLEAQRMKIPLSPHTEELLRRVFQFEKKDKAKWIEQMENTQTTLVWGKKKKEKNIVDMVKNLESDLGGLSVAEKAPEPDDDDENDNDDA